MPSNTVYMKNRVLLIINCAFKEKCVIKKCIASD